MKRNFTVLFLLFSCFTFAQTPTFQWNMPLGGTGLDDVKDIAFDSLNNVCVVGIFSQTMDFDPSAVVYNLTPATPGKSSVFIAKYSPSGALIFAQNIGGDNFVEVNELKLDVNGNIYIVGEFRGTCDFDPSSTITQNATSNGDYDIYVAKYDFNGLFGWVKTIGAVGTGSAEYATSIAVDNFNQALLFTGYFTGTVDFDPSVSSNADLISAGSNDVFVAKIDLNGGFIWAKSIGGTSSDMARRIKIDNFGSFYILGGFVGTAYFNPVSSTSNYLTASGTSPDIFIVKFNVLGHYLWSMKVGSTAGDYGYGLAVDADNDFYITGKFNGVVDFNQDSVDVFNLTATNSSGSIFYAKYNTSGSLIWAKTLEIIGASVGEGIEVDAFKNVYLTGGFNGLNADFNPDTNVVDTALFSSGAINDQNSFNAIYDLNGNYKWAYGFGNASNDDLGWCVKIDNDNNVYYGGKFGGANVDFDPTNATSIGNSNGNKDLYITKFSQCLINTSLTRNGYKLTSSAVGNYSYQWMNCTTNTIIAGATLPFYTATHNGTYALIISNGTCTDTSVCTLVTGLGIIENNNANAFEIYPNPANNTVNLNLQNFRASQYTVQIINSLGQIVLKQEISKQQTTINISSLVNGIYSFKLVSGDDFSVKKVIKQ